MFLYVIVKMEEDTVGNFFSDKHPEGELSWREFLLLMIQK
jgi:hypothetical protein